MLHCSFVIVAVVLQTFLLQPLPRDGASDSRGIVMDAEFEDWNAITPILIDPADAPNAAVDFGEVRIHHDERFVYLLIDFGRTVNAQGLDGTAMILFDVDGDAKTGRTQHGLEGVDLIVDLTPANLKSPEKRGMGMGLRSTTYEPDPNDMNARKLSVYDVDLAFSPTYAGRRMEFRINRGVELPNTPVLFNGERLTAKLVFVDLEQSVADKTDPFVHELGTIAKPQAAVESDDDGSDDPLRRGENSNLRVLSWNVSRGAMFTNAAPFARTLAALKPDVVLLQELTDKHSEEQVQALLESMMPSSAGEKWNVIVGAGGGDLRCAVASRLALHDVASMQPLPMPNRDDRTVRATAANVEHEGQRLLVASVHLRCCGRIDGAEDQQRKVEAQAISAAINAAIRSGEANGVVVAGDFNLVGSRDPVEIMAAGADVDRSPLTIVPTYQIDGLSNATWFDPKQPFAPGRLDFVLYSDSRLELKRSFIYDSRDLSPRWLEQYSVKPDDTVTTSDHMPVVVDFSWLGTNQ